MSKLYDLLYTMIDRLNKSVKTSAQTLTEAEKTQARANIGAMASTFAPTAESVGADPKGTAAAAVSAHNTNTAAHADIRNLITGLADRLNALANSDDTTLDQMKEVVDYIKDNRELIESVTTSKVNVTDIINNLTSNISNKPLSAAQGVILKGLIDTLSAEALRTSDVVNTLTSSSTTKPLSAYQGNILRKMIESAGGGGGIALEGAKANQYPVIKAVDASGKPTEWEAADRTHWKEVIGEDAEVISQRYIDFTGSTATLTGLGANIFQDGHTYKVNWNGTEYTCKAYLSDGIVHLGNGSLAGAPVTTAEPFCIVGAGITCMVFKDTETAQSVKFKVDSVAEVVYHQIDPKYIKDMYYTEGGRVEILPETTVVIENDNASCEVQSLLVAGETYTVKWNGTEYDCVAQDASDIMMGGAVLLGDDTLVGLASNGEPFLIAIAEQDGTKFAQIITNGETTSVTISIYHDAETVHKLNNKYLNLDWLPVYKEEPVTIYEDTVHLGTSKLKKYDVPPFSIVVGKKYSVVWNDKVYEVTAKRQDASYQGNQVSCTYLGNISVAGLTFEGLVNEDTGEDFCIGSNSLTGFYIYGTVKGSDNTITVAEYALVPNKLPKEYLPNGVPYCADGGMTELPVAGEWTENDGFPVTAPMGLEIGKTYVVNWDGTEYEVVGQDAYATTGGQLPGVFLGNGANLGGANTGEPFMILEVSAEVAAQIGGYGMIGSMDGSLNIPFTIYRDGTEIRKLDERCMPESVESVIIRSSTEGSTKLFKLTVDDSGTITATEAT